MTSGAPCQIRDGIRVPYVFCAQCPSYVTKMPRQWMGKVGGGLPGCDFVSNMSSSVM